METDAQSALWAMSFRDARCFSHNGNSPQDECLAFGHTQYNKTAQVLLPHLQPIWTANATKHFVSFKAMSDPLTFRLRTAVLLTRAKRQDWQALQADGINSTCGAACAAFEVRTNMLAAGWQGQQANGSRAAPWGPKGFCGSEQWQAQVAGRPVQPHLAQPGAARYATSWQYLGTLY